MKKSLFSLPVAFLRLPLTCSMLLAMFVFIAIPAQTSQQVDNRLYAGLLVKHTRDGLVDYAGFKTEHPKLKNIWSTWRVSIRTR